MQLVFAHTPCIFTIVRVSRTCHVLTAKPFSARASERDNAKEQAVGAPDIDCGPGSFRETKKALV